MGVQFAGNILVQSNSGPLPISMGGTGQTTSPTALNALLPVQAGQSGKVLTTDGTNASWSASAAGPNGTYVGYMDGVRITPGVARYTGNFTVPATAFPAQ